jgi:PAS domain S-box-containing protein
MLTTLLQNIAILISISVLYHFISRSFKGTPWAVSVLNGVLLGATAILAMLTPFEIEKGLFYDARSVVIGIAAFFGGPLTGAIAAAIALAYRILRGGVGVVPGSLSIVFPAILSIIAWQARQRYLANPQGRKPHMVLGTWFLGFLIHASVVLAQLALPGGRWHQVIPLMLFPFLAVFPLVFSLICLLFFDNERIAKAALDLAESEERYRSLFENHHTVMLIIDPSTGRIIDANPAAVEFYGWDRATLTSMRIQDINTLGPEEVEAEMARARTRDKNVFYFKHRCANADPIDVEVYSGPITIKGKELLYSIVHDNSQRIRAERELQALTQSLEQQVQERTRSIEEQTCRLQELNKEYEAFAYSVSHDLRAPLRAISGFSAILGESLQELGILKPSTDQQSASAEANTLQAPDLAHILHRIQSNVSRMQQLIDDMLMLSRAGTRKMNSQPIDFTQMAREILGELTEQQKGRHFECTVQDGMTAIADPDLARILLVNLISNAVKFTKDRDIAHIEVGAEQNSDAPRFFVRDNGVGFDVAAAGERLFAPFQRFHSEASFEGTGIGLSIVKRVVARHNGKISAESAPGQGATFYFDFGKAK